VKVQPAPHYWISLLLLSVVTLTSCQMLGKSGNDNNVQNDVVIGIANVDFGTVTVGNSKTVTNTLTNFKTAAVTIASVSGLTPDFQLNGIAFPLVLNPGQQATFSFQFKPSAPGKPSISVTFTGDGQNYATVSMTGNAISVGQLAPSPSSLNFGNMKVGKSQTSTVTLLNSGSTDVTINAANLSGTGFSMSKLALPITLPANQSTTMSVTFTPPNGGNFSGSISFTTLGSQNAKQQARAHGKAQAQDDQVVIPLAGNGVTPGTLSANPATLAFGTVVVGSHNNLSETLTNTGASAVTISQANVSGTGFSISGLALPATLNPNQSVTFTASLSPTSAGSPTGTLSIVSDASNSPLNVSMSGTAVVAGAVTANPTTLAFGNVQVTKTANLSETITNTGGTAVTISQANVSGTGFSISGLSLPAVLNPNQSVSFTATFAPSGASSATGNLAIVSDAPNSPLNIGLSGNGVTQGQLSPNPANLGFGNVLTGSSKTLSETLTNSGGTSLTISAASASGTGYSISGLTLPLTLNAGQGTTFNVKFAPTATGNASGSVNITSNGANPNLSIPLSGAGVTPGALTPNPASLSFGSVQVGDNTDLSETLTNTGGSAVTISQANITGTGFSVIGLALPATLNPTQTVTFTVRFAPTSAGSASGTLAIVSDGSNSPLNIPLSGTGLTPGSLTATPSSVNFGNVVIGNSPSVSVKLSNTGGTSVTISSATVSGTGFSFNGLTLPMTLNAGQNTTFNVVFSPTSAGNSSGTVIVNSDAINPALDVQLSGKGVTLGQLSPNPATLAFGSVATGSSSTLSETLTNTGGSSLTISAANVSGTGYTMTGLTLPLTLNAGQSTTFNVRFAPATVGDFPGSISITSNGSNPNLNIDLSGTGVTPGALSSNPASLSFGNVQTGKNSSLSETLTNTGGATVTISQANVTGTGFSISGLTLPAKLNANQTVTFTVTFAPTASGAASGTLAIVSDASNSPLNIALSGTGVTPGTLSPNPASLAFGSVQIGNSSNLSETLKNTGGSDVTITQANVTGTGYSISGLTLPVTLTSNQSVTFTATFAPTGSGASNGTLSVVSNATNSPLNIALTGTGITQGQLSPNPTTLAFGSVQTGSSANLNETLTNTGGTAVTISQANVTGSGFSISGLTLPTTLNANQSVTFTATFAPTGAGAASGTLAVVSDGANSPLNISMTGNGTAPGQLSVSPTTLNFGNVVVGQNSALGGTLAASRAPVTITAGSSNSSEFVLSGITFPKTLNSGQSATFTVTFTPNANGAASANMTFTSNATNAPTVQALTGNGQAPPQHWVDLSWDTSSGAVSYNAYRKLPTDANYTQITSGDSTTSYRDNNVAAGTTYDYVVTAVDSSNNESSFSNMAVVTVPTP